MSGFRGDLRELRFPLYLSRNSVILPAHLYGRVKNCRELPRRSVIGARRRWYSPARRWSRTCT